MSFLNRKQGGPGSDDIFNPVQSPFGGCANLYGSLHVGGQIDEFVNNDSLYHSAQGCSPSRRKCTPCSLNNALDHVFW